MNKSWMPWTRKRGGIRCNATSMGHIPLRQPPADGPCAPDPSTDRPSAFPIQSLGSQSSPVQSRLPCAQCCACCAVLRSALSPFPPRLPTFSFSTSTAGTTDEPVARRHPSITIRVPVRGHADDKVSWSRLIRRRRTRSSPRPVSSSQPPRPSPSPAFEIRSAPYPRQVL